MALEHPLCRHRCLVLVVPEAIAGDDAPFRYRLDRFSFGPQSGACARLLWRLSLRKAQGASFKFNGKWPNAGNPAFLFRSQTIDNMIWTLASAVPIWTGYEAL